MDQTYEADDPDPGLAVQRRSHGYGLHAQELHSGRWRHFERYEPGLLRDSKPTPLRSRLRTSNVRLVSTIPRRVHIRPGPPSFPFRLAADKSPCPAPEEEPA